MEKKNIVKIEPCILEAPDLTPPEKFVLLGIQVYGGDETMTTKTLANLLGMKQYTVGVAKRSLVDKGWLKEVGNNGRGKRYEINVLGGGVENG